MQRVSIDTIDINRPSHKELTRKLKKARELSAGQQLSIVEPFSFAADAIELGYDVEDLCAIVYSLLNEILPDYYAGGRPPQRAYEDCIKDADLFAFEWQSEVLSEIVYFKFAIVDDWLWLVSLHKSRKK